MTSQVLGNEIDVNMRSWVTSKENGKLGYPIGRTIGIITVRWDQGSGWTIGTATVMGWGPLQFDAPDVIGGHYNLTTQT